GAVLGVPEVHHARLGDLQSRDPLGAEERAVAAAPVLEHPDRALRADHRVLPRAPRVGERYVRPLVASDAILLPAVQPVGVTHRAYQQRRCGMRTMRHLIPHRRIPPAQSALRQLYLFVACPLAYGYTSDHLPRFPAPESRIALECRLNPS